MIVLLVNTESPAWQAEMKVGDILMSIDGKQINIIEDYYAAVDGMHGRTLRFVVIRRGEEVVCNVSL